MGPLKIFISTKALTIQLNHQIITIRKTKDPFIVFHNLNLDQILKIIKSLIPMK